RLHHRVDVADRKAVARSLLAIDLDDEVGLAEQVEPARVGHTTYRRDLGLERLGQALQLGEIAAEDLHRVLALHAGHRLLDIVLDVLREIEVDPDEFTPQALAHLPDQLNLGHAALPFVARLERHKEFRDERAV